MYSCSCFIQRRGISMNSETHGRTDHFMFSAYLQHLITCPNHTGLRKYCLSPIKNLKHYEYRRKRYDIRLMFISLRPSIIQKTLLPSIDKGRKTKFSTSPNFLVRKCKMLGCRYLVNNHSKQALRDVAWMSIGNFSCQDF